MPAAGIELIVSANTHIDDKRAQTEMVMNNPQTYLQVVKPYLKFGEDKNPEKHFQFANDILQKFIANGTMVVEDENTFYVYQQINTKTNFTYLGVICNVAASDYYKGKIKVHENTLTEKENQLIEHISISGAIGEPVLLTHHANSEIENLLFKVIANNTADVDFTDEVGRQHLIYKVNEQTLISEFQQAYSQLSDFYIADGHHRSAACAGFYRNNGNNDGGYLACVVPANHLHIDSFYRAYKCKNNFNLQDFLAQLNLNFKTTKVVSAFTPTKPNQFGLCTRSGWYQLEFMGKLENPNAVEKLDVSILEKYVFNEILEITDSKTDNQLTFIKGNAEINAIQKQVENHHFDIVFTVFPCKIEEVFTIADEQLIMPPKSTYIEPKLRTGLTVQLV